jgi:hypothetical protein
LTFNLFLRTFMKPRKSWKFSKGICCAEVSLSDSVCSFWLCTTVYLVTSFSGLKEFCIYIFCSS